MNTFQKKNYSRVVKHPPKRYQFERYQKYRRHLYPRGAWINLIFECLRPITMPILSTVWGLFPSKTGQPPVQECQKNETGQNKSTSKTPETSRNQNKNQSYTSANSKGPAPRDLDLLGVQGIGCRLRLLGRRKPEENRTQRRVSLQMVKKGPKKLPRTPLQNDHRPTRFHGTHDIEPMPQPRLKKKNMLACSFLICSSFLFSAFSDIRLDCFHSQVPSS